MKIQTKFNKILSLFLFTLITLFSIMSCGKKNNNQTTLSLNFSGFAAATATGLSNAFRGGIFLEGRNTSTLEIISFGIIDPYSQKSFTRDLPNGTWEFLAYGWDCNDVNATSSCATGQGVIRCEFINNIKLSGGPFDLRLNLSTTKCSQAFQTSTAQYSSHNITLNPTFKFCSVYNSSSNGCTPSSAVKSFKVVLEDNTDYTLGLGLSMPFGTTASCQNLISGKTSHIIKGLNLPITKDLKVKIKMYNLPGCASGSFIEAAKLADSAKGSFHFVESEKTIYVYKNDPSLEVNYSSNIKFKQVSAGAFHACAISNDYKLYCWGANGRGQIGNGLGGGGTVANATTLTLVGTTALASTEYYKKVTTGSHFTCAITNLNKVYCWGYNNFGQLGDGTTISASAESLNPTAVDMFNLGANQHFVEIDAGNLHVCGITNLNNLYCWGKNSSGEVGVASAAEAKPIFVANGNTALGAGDLFVTVQAGANSSCALTKLGFIYCWGSNLNGQLGDNAGSRGSPGIINKVVAAVGQKFYKLMTSSDHSCAITTTQKLYCWGINTTGQLGINSTTDALSPSLVDTAFLSLGETFYSIAGGARHTCASTSLGKTLCWGENHAHKLGNGTTVATMGTALSIPTVANLANLNSSTSLTSFSLGKEFSCGLSSFGDIFCWGGNSNSQLGDGGTTQIPIPLKVIP